MTVTSGQSYLERALAEGVLDSVNPNGAIRIDEDLVNIGAVAEWVGSYIGTVVNNAITNATIIGGAALSVNSTQDNAPGLVVQSADASPAVPVFQVLRGDNELEGTFHKTWLGTAKGLANALNCLDAQLWIREDQTLPAGASNGQYVLRPRVIA